MCTYEVRDVARCKQNKMQKERGRKKVGEGDLHCGPKLNAVFMSNS